MKTNQDFEIHYKIANTDYGKIVVPKGTRVTHKTAMGIDKNYHFVDEVSWVEEKYPDISAPLIWDIRYYGLNVPKQFVDYEK